MSSDNNDLMNVTRTLGDIFKEAGLGFFGIVGYTKQDDDLHLGIASRKHAALTEQDKIALTAAFSKNGFVTKRATIPPTTTEYIEITTGPDDLNAVRRPLIKALQAQFS